MSDSRRSRAGARRKRRRWASMSDDELLDQRLCDLDLELDESPLRGRLDRLADELAERGLRFRPYAWLSTDWFTPDRSNGFAVPFYLAHPRLQRLEHRLMLEVEGGTQDWCMRIMRHEAAHAIDNAYRLHWKKSWREVFGRFSQNYDAAYSPDPMSREYVQNLPYWYAQSHPAEDWAETFAVWLASGNRWRKRYVGWPALEKLEYVDELMRTIADQPVARRTRAVDEPLRSVRMTLREYYERKQAHYSDESRPAFDGQLRRLFTVDAHDRRPTAASFLRKHRSRLVRHVSAVTGQTAYLVDHVIVEMARRGRTLGLHLKSSSSDTLLDVGIMVTALTMQFLHGGHPRYHR
ncbi:MAG: putative zinc-binding metallopeptidase [Planctomycetes bacterium]|nr:putative zinc-binding metallopeptidase [Planctomycetota bacterium]